MRYIQFYTWGAVSKRLIPACGDRAVIIVDGREHLSKAHAIALEEGQKRGYPGFNIWEGESLIRSRPRILRVYPTSGPYGAYPENKVECIE